MQPNLTLFILTEPKPMKIITNHTYHGLRQYINTFALDLKYFLKLSTNLKKKFNRIGDKRTASVLGSFISTKICMV